MEFNPSQQLRASGQLLCEEQEAAVNEIKKLGYSKGISRAD
jgi:hypothetical protein